MAEIAILVVLFLLLLWILIARRKTGDPRVRSGKRKPTTAGKLSRFKDLSSRKFKAESSGDSQENWTPKDREITIQGYRIPGGLIYVGKRLPALKKNEVEPALIDPSLPAAPRSKRKKTGLPRLDLSYQRLSPDARAAYLTWLEDGRQDPSVDSGCLSLFLFGLERRALFDAITSDAARSQIPDIVKEINRLLIVHLPDEAFQTRARCLLDALQAAWPNKRILSNISPRADARGFNPWRFEFELARMVKEDKPIPPEWVFTWLTRRPDVKKRAPAERCPEELRDLFEKRFKVVFDEGARFEASKKRIRLRCRPLNPVIAHKQITYKTDLYAPAAPDGLETRLRDLFDQCQDELDPYSRELAKTPGARGSLPALAVLPEALGASHMGEEAAALRSWAFEALKNVTAEGEKPEEVVALVDADRFLEAWPTENKGEFLASEAGKLARLLKRWGVGVEPDPRFGGPPFKAGGKAALFELPMNAPIEPSPGYAAAAILMHLSVAIAAADGVVTKKERTHITDHVESGLSLAMREKRRLLAHLRWLFAVVPDLTGVKPALTDIKQRLKGVAEADRRDMGWFLIALAGVNGAIGTDQIALLSEIYRTLDLDPDELPGHIQAFTAESAPENGATATGPPEANGEGVDPDPPRKSVPGAEQGMDGVRRKREGAAKVSAAPGARDAPGGPQ